MSDPLFRRSATVVVDTIQIVSDFAELGRYNLDMTFSVERSLKPEPNTAEIKIWNLNADHRAQLEETKTVTCTIEAGYSGQTSLIFAGVLRTVFSTREGPDIITTLQSGDGEKKLQNSRIGITIPAGASNLSILQKIVKALDIGEGNLSTLSTELLRSRSLFPQGGILSGSARQAMNAATRSMGLEWSVQEGTLQLLKTGEPLLGNAVLLSPDTGLIGSPTIDNKGVLSARALLMPDMLPGKTVSVKSERTEGFFRIEKSKYTGDTAGADWYVDIEAKKR